VARRARASKATLYRRWEDKPSLVVDAMVRAKQAPQVEPHDTGTLRGDLVSTFCGAHGMGHKETTGMLGAVITALSSDPEFARRFREAFIAPKVAVSSAIYQRAIDRGEISPDVDLDVIAPALAGILLHRSFVLGLAPDDETVERVIDHVILPAVGHPAAGVHPRQKKDRNS
jgi:AcrR family transcriptional regulator